MPLGSSSEAPVILLKLGARHVMAATLHVFRKGMNDPARIGRGHFERRGEVEQVTALYTLVKRAQLGSEHPIQWNSYQPSCVYPYSCY